MNVLVLVPPEGRTFYKGVVTDIKNERFTGSTHFLPVIVQTKQGFVFLQV